MRSVRISDNVIWNLWKTDPSGSMPAYLLRFISTIKGKESDHLKLYSHPERFYPGENWITEDIDRKGAIFLTTQEGQSDLAFSVTGKHVYAFDSDEYIVEDVEVHENTQHVKTLLAITSRMSCILKRRQVLPSRSGKWCNTRAACNQQHCAHTRYQ